MGDIDKVNINGKLIAWQDVDLRFGGDGFHGFTSITYGASRDRPVAHGQGRSGKPRGRGAGKVSYDNVKIKGFHDSIQRLRAFAAARAGTTSYGDGEFPGVLQYLDPDSGDPIVIKWEGLAIVKDSSSAEEGDAPLQEELELQPLDQTSNGLTIARV